MISTDDRSPSGGRDSTTTRLTNFNNNNYEDHHHSNATTGLYYQYNPSSNLNHQSESESHSHSHSVSQSTPSSPILRHRSPPHHHSHQQLVLRDPHPHHHPLHNHNTLSISDNNLSGSSSQLAIPPSTSISSSSPPASPPNGIADFIQQTLTSRLIPKLGSIVKRFSLNYSGEGLVTDRQRTRTVRVGIRFQVQVDSFVNNRQGQERPRAILRTQSAPAVEQLDSGFSSPTTDVFPPNRQLALEYNNCSGNRSISQSNSSSTLSVADYNCCGVGSSSSNGHLVGAGATSPIHPSGGIQIGIGDSCSSGVSSEASSPTLDRRSKNPISLPFAYHPQHSTSNTLAFHNRINQALNSYYRNNQEEEEPAESSRGRRSSVQVYRRGSASPERSGSISLEDHSPSSPPTSMEDSSSYQVLRHFPGSNVNSLNELSWETAAFEKEIRDRIQWLGDKVSSIRVPRIISQLVDFGRDYAHENPVTALILLALCLTSSAPVLIFLVFAIATILVTFLGFLFVEGTLLTGATVVFGGVILIVGFVTLTAVLLGMLGYFTTTQAYLVVTGRSRIFDLLRKLPIIGRLFPESVSPSHNLPISKQEDDLLTNQQCSNLLANGKLANGYGPYGHGGIAAQTNTPYYVEEEDDDDEIQDILDSDVEVEDEIIAKKADKMDLEVEVVPLITNGTTSDLSTSSELEDEEDLGNQEVISGLDLDHHVNGDHHEDEIHVNGEVDKVSLPTTVPVPEVIINGHGKDKTSKSPEVSENEEESVA